MRRTVAMIVIGVLVGALWSSAAFAGNLSGMTAATRQFSLSATPNLSDAYAMGTFNRIPEQAQQLGQTMIPAGLHGLALRFIPSKFLAVASQPAYMTAQPLPLSIALGYDRVFSLHDALNRYGYLSLQPVMSTRSVAMPPVNLSGAFAGLAGAGSFLAFSPSNASGLGSASGAPSLYQTVALGNGATPSLDRTPKYTGPILIASTGPSVPTRAVAAQQKTSLVADQTAASSNAASDAANGAAAFGDTPPAFASRLQDVTTAVSAPIRLGAFSVSNVNVAGFEQAPTNDARAHTYQWTAGTSFDLREKNRRMNVNLDTNFEHVNTGSVASFSYAVPATAATATTGLTTPAFTGLQAVNPAFLAPTDPIDVTARGLGAGFAVPLTHRVTLGLQYGAQRFTGSYGVTGTPNLDTSKYSYLGNLTFALPRNTAITFSARQYRYQDNLVPSNTSSETRADVNFTVKL
jgi:hypothetical protein